MFLYLNIKYPLVFDCNHPKCYLITNRNGIKSWLKNPFAKQALIFPSFCYQLIIRLYELRDRNKIFVSVFNNTLKFFFHSLKKRGIRYLVLDSNSQLNRVIAQRCHAYELKSIHLMHGLGNVIFKGGIEELRLHNCSDYSFVWSSSMKDFLIKNKVKSENEVFVCGYTQPIQSFNHSNSNDIVIIGQPVFIFEDDELVKSITEERNTLFSDVIDQYCSKHHATLIYKPHPLELKTEKGRHYLSNLSANWGIKIITEEAHLMTNYDNFIVFYSTYGIELLLYQKNVFKFISSSIDYDLTHLGLQQTFSNISEFKQLIDKAPSHTKRNFDYFIQPFIGCESFSKQMNTLLDQ